MRLKRTPEGYSSLDRRFRFIKESVASYRNGCWKTAWRLLDNGKLASDPFDESLGDCKQIAQDILNPED